MIIIKIPYIDAQRDAVSRAIEMSQWCKDNGLVHSKDYDWSFMRGQRQIHFRFYSDDESRASMFALMWNR
jgi:hypothetical protein